MKNQKNQNAMKNQTNQNAMKNQKNQNVMKNQKKNINIMKKATMFFLTITFAGLLTLGCGSNSSTDSHKNNADSFDTPSSHWSLLLLNIPSGKLYHFDSCGSSNHDAAILTAEKLYVLLKR